MSLLEQDEQVYFFLVVMLSVRQQSLRVHSTVVAVTSPLQHGQLPGAFSVPRTLLFSLQIKHVVLTFVICITIGVGRVVVARSGFRG
jgi:hypothetical protein